MVIYRKLKRSTLDPREISKMTLAYEVTLIELGIERADPRTETIASAIIHRACTGERNVRALADFAIKQITPQADADDAPTAPTMPDFGLQAYNFA